MSIRDNQKDRLITVTMKELKRDDQDTYWCGISRVGTDRGVSVKVIIVPGKNFLVPTVRLRSGGSGCPPARAEGKRPSP